MGWKLWDQSLSQEIATLAQVDCAAVESRDEKVDSRLYRLTKLFLRGGSDRGVPLTDSQMFDADCIVTMMETAALRFQAGEREIAFWWAGARHTFYETVVTLFTCSCMPLAQKSSVGFLPTGRTSAKPTPAGHG